MVDATISITIVHRLVWYEYYWTILNVNLIFRIPILHTELKSRNTYVLLSLLSLIIRHTIIKHEHVVAYWEHIGTKKPSLVDSVDFWEFYNNIIFNPVYFGFLMDSTTMIRVLFYMILLSYIWWKSRNLNCICSCISCHRALDDWYFVPLLWKINHWVIKCDALFNKMYPLCFAMTVPRLRLKLLSC